MGEKFIMNTLKTVATTLLLISFLISLVVGLSGCATSGNGDSVLPKGETTMANIYDGQLDGSYNTEQLNNVRAKVPKTNMTKTSYRSQRTRERRYYSYRQSSSSSPKMLPNPTIAIYVFPHFNGGNQDYVPGHAAYTKLYKEAHFALPGEPTEMA